MNHTLNLDDRSKIGVYIIHNEKTNETYVGSGILGKRKSSHEYLLKNNKHYNYKLQNAYNKNPDFDFIAVPIENIDSSDDVRKTALDIEQTIIDEFIDNDLLLNICKNAINPMMGFQPNEESLEKKRLSTLKKWQDPEYREKTIKAQREGWNKISDLDRAKISEKCSIVQKKSHDSGNRIPTKGQTRSEEFCQNNSNNVSELWKKSEYRQKQLDARINNPNYTNPNKFKPVVIDDKKYNSITDAAKEYGLTKTGVVGRIKSPHFSNWNYLK